MYSVKNFFRPKIPVQMVSLAIDVSKLSSFPARVVIADGKSCRPWRFSRFFTGLLELAKDESSESPAGRKGGELNAADD